MLPPSFHIGSCRSHGKSDNFLTIPILIGDAVDEIVGAGHVDFAAIFVILKRMAVVILATAAAQWVMNLCNNKMTYGVVQDIRNNTADHVSVGMSIQIGNRQTFNLLKCFIADILPSGS